MPSDRRRVRRALRTVCSQHLWMPVPQELEDLIVDAATAQIAPVDIDFSPYGALFELAARMAHEYVGYGTFATIYDDEVTVLPIASTVTSSVLTYLANRTFSHFGWRARPKEDMEAYKYLESVSENNRIPMRSSYSL